MAGWIGVDLDGTLAKYDKWEDALNIGDPIPLMVNRVKSWIESGTEVRIFTARVSGHGLKLYDGTIVDAITPIKAWCVKHLGRELEVTNVKDFGMIELWDDRAIPVEMNTGRVLMVR